MSNLMAPPPPPTMGSTRPPDDGTLLLTDFGEQCGMCGMSKAVIGTATNHVWMCPNCDFVFDVPIT